MQTSVIADSEQLSILTKVLNDYCAKNGLIHDLDRNTVAQRLVVMFGQGAETEESLFAGLDVGNPAYAVAAE